MPDFVSKNINTFADSEANETFSQEDMLAYEDSLKIYRDLKNSIDTAREEGRQEGRQEGREEGIEIVLLILSLQERGEPVESIATQAGISLERVIDILRKAGRS